MLIIEIVERAAEFYAILEAKSWVGSLLPAIICEVYRCLIGDTSKALDFAFEGFYSSSFIGVSSTYFFIYIFISYSSDYFDTSFTSSFSSSFPSSFSSSFSYYI